MNNLDCRIFILKADSIALKVCYDYGNIVTKHLRTDHTTAVDSALVSSRLEDEQATANMLITVVVMVILEVDEEIIVRKETLVIKMD